MFDLEYRDTGMFTLFMANTPQGEIAWNEIARHTEGTGKVLRMYKPQTIVQLRKAGYSVGRAKKPTMSLDDILAELGA